MMVDVSTGGGVVTGREVAPVGEEGASAVVPGLPSSGVQARHVFPIGQEPPPEQQ